MTTYRVSARESPRGGGLAEAAHTVGGWDPEGYDLLVFIVHGFNNSFGRAQQRWDSDVFPKIQSLVRIRRKRVAVALFFWPGDSHGPKAMSASSYPFRIQSAIDAGVLLGEYIVRIAENSPAMNVSLVGHSLGCRVVLSAAKSLCSMSFEARLEQVILLGAAVPVGDCQPPGPWQIDRLPGRQSVYYSSEDTILRRYFPIGETIARRSGVISNPPFDAVGLGGLPLDRWSHCVEVSGIDHDQYLVKSTTLRPIAEMFGLTTSKEPDEHILVGRKLGRHTLDTRAAPTPHSPRTYSRQ